MPKNLIPFLIVLVIVSIGVMGIYLLLNQKSNTSNALDLNTKNNFVPITPTEIPSVKPTETMQILNSQTLADGLKIEDEKIGNGRKVQSGDTVIINYIGTLANGQKFDSSYDRNQPFTTQIGVGQVIKGWDEGVIGMKVGGRRRLTIPSSLGYGNQAVGPIPADSTLIFEVELMGIK